MDFFDKKHAGYFISTDPGKLDRDLIHRFLSKDSYWAEGTTIKEVGDTMEGSLCYGVYFGEQQIGFASVETDYSSYAYLTDIFIVETFRGQGLSQWLIETILAHPDLQELDSWMLITEDAHTLYEKFGFKAVPGSPGLMERLKSRQ
ncbi:MAG: GNAT family N-acetyltransferase [Lewinellaceae bacterium]|nr:GNAT family N-acetyltransferase [Saprospiraceae bacterium]MCB9337732.1 GNAT family N-acetyltransferase [Lewinellaceae bacterium]